MELGGGFATECVLRFWPLDLLFSRDGFFFNVFDVYYWVKTKLVCLKNNNNKIKGQVVCFE